jgi:RNA polymerase sigma factor (sigma-70 family)
MVALRQDAEDLLQGVLVRVLENIGEFRGKARFKSWLFFIATHVCLDDLRHKKRWRVEAQLVGEREADADPEKVVALRQLMAQTDFRYEIREHIAFCFSCIARTLPPEEQAALMLKEVLGFTAEESGAILGVSEPVFRHRLAAARATMMEDYDGLCALVNKTGVCHQCRGLREIARDKHRGADLVQIEVAPGVTLNRKIFSTRGLPSCRTRILKTVAPARCTMLSSNSYRTGKKHAEVLADVLQLERPERDALRSDTERPAESEIRRAAGQRLLGANLRDMGIVVLLGEMREDEILRASVEGVGIRQELADNFVREMPLRTHNALLDVPWI